MDSATCPRCGNRADPPECLCLAAAVRERLRLERTRPRLAFNFWGGLLLACASVVPAAFFVLVTHDRQTTTVPGREISADLEGAACFLALALLVLTASFLGTVFGIVGVGVRRYYRGAALAWAGLALNFLFLSPYLLCLGSVLLGALAGRW
jgi:hypothetical protein